MRGYGEGLEVLRYMAPHMRFLSPKRPSWDFRDSCVFAAVSGGARRSVKRDFPTGRPYPQNALDTT